MSYRLRKSVGITGWYIIVTAICALILIPLWTTIVSAFEPNQYIPSTDNIQFWPYKGYWSFSNIWIAYTSGQLNGGVMVTLGLTIATLVPGILVSTMIGFLFSKKDFWGRNTLFMILLASMMIPGNLAQIPSYILYRILHWTGTSLPLVFPGGLSINVFNIFLARQFIMEIPDELFDAAKMDGCSNFRMYWTIVLPLVKPMLATMTILGFVGTWNDFYGPMIYLNSYTQYNLQLRVMNMVTEFSGGYSGTLHSMADVLAAVPVVAVFLFLQRYFVRGISVSGLKG